MTEQEVIEAEVVNEVEQVKEKSKSMVVVDPDNMLMDSARFSQLQRVANAISKSSMVPTHYQNMSNVMIAMYTADRLGMDPFMFMQNSYVVHGKPGLQATLIISLINQSGLFVGGLQFNEGDGWCQAKAIRKDTGEEVLGDKVTMAIAKAEGWLDKPGSKWKTMPSLMLKYRAASWFSRTVCPEVTMGYLTTEELHDIEAQTTHVRFTNQTDTDECGVPDPKGDLNKMRPDQRKAFARELEAYAAYKGWESVHLTEAIKFPTAGNLTDAHYVLFEMSRQPEPEPDSSDVPQ